MKFSQFIKQTISTRKIRFDIITIFVSLFIIFAAITTSFNYANYRRNALNLSKEIMEKVSNSLIAKISGIKAETELIAEATRGLITSERMLSLDHESLIHYLLNLLRVNNLTYSIEIETLNGNLLAAINLTLTPLPLPES